MARMQTQITLCMSFLACFLVTVESFVGVTSPLGRQQRVLMTAPTTMARLVLDPSSFALDPIAFSLSSLTTAVTTVTNAPPELGGISYSRESYYTILALYLLSFPGLWSTIQRSTSAKVKRKTYVSAGANSASGKSLRNQAGEIMACTCVCVCRGSTDIFALSFFLTLTTNNNNNNCYYSY
jgi:hypothetical protein